MSNRRSTRLVSQLLDRTGAFGRVCGAPASGIDPPNRDDQDKDVLRLTRIIEGEIVPRLLMSLTLAKQAAEASETFDGKPTEDELAEFARLVLVHESGVASAYVRSMREQGTALECICTDWLAPAALRLGELWEQNECDFNQLSVGLNRLESVMRALDFEEPPTRSRQE